MQEFYSETENAAKNDGKPIIIVIIIIMIRIHLDQRQNDHDVDHF
jgi:hypothetical protein